MGKARIKQGAREPVPAPRGLRASELRLAGETFAVLSFPATSPSIPATLTPAQRAIIEAILAGKSNAEIARARRTSLRTVANQVASVFRALDVGSRAALVSKLMRPSPDVRR